MSNILDYICGPLGSFLYFIYNNITFRDYGFAIIIFTILVKLVLMPLTVKQYKSSAKMQELQPIIAEVQKKYKNEKQKMNEELMKVYQEHGYNPAGGCLPMLVQMPIIISLYWVIVQPLKFMLGKTMAQIDQIVNVAASLDPTIQKVAKLSNQRELLALNFFNNHQDKLAQTAGALSQNELINFNFLGFLHLGINPSYVPGVIMSNPGVYIPLLIIPIMAVISTYISTKLSMPNMQNNQGGSNAMASSMTNSMLYIGPLMTLLFSFQLPAGVGLYWSVGYIFTIFQQLYINKHVIKKNAKPALAQGAQGKDKAQENKLEQAKDGTQNKEALTAGDNGPANQIPGGAKKPSNKGSGKKGSSNKKKRS